MARVLPEHVYVGTRDGCGVYGQSISKDGTVRLEDLNILSFERFRWGGVRRDNIAYVAFDLEQFVRAPRLQPTGADIRLGQQLIDYLRALPPGTTAARAAADPR